MYSSTCYLLQVAEILKDRLSWYRDCRSVDVFNIIPTGNGGTIELIYMQVFILWVLTDFFFLILNL
jgi:hypothetical protein